MKLLYFSVGFIVAIAVLFLLFCFKPNKSKPSVVLCNSGKHTHDGTIKEDCIIKGFAK